MKARHTLVLLRKYGEQGTNGTLSYQGRTICYTIELPWKDNKRRISCIPEGLYKLQRHRYQKHGEQIGIPHVVGRDGILIHAANHALTELLGCIAPVMELTGAGAGIKSRLALAELKALVYALWEMGCDVYLDIKSAT